MLVSCKHDVFGGMRQSVYTFAGATLVSMVACDVHTRAWDNSRNDINVERAVLRYSYLVVDFKVRYNDLKFGAKFGAFHHSSAQHCLGGFIASIRANQITKLFTSTRKGSCS